MAKRDMPVRKEIVTSKVEVDTTEDAKPKKLVVDLETNVSDPVKLKIANCDLLNVREGPSKESKVLYKVPAGTVVLVDAMNGEWFHIQGTAGQVKPGYILGEFTEEV